MPPKRSCEEASIPPLDTEGRPIFFRTQDPGVYALRGTVTLSPRERAREEFVSRTAGKKTADPAAGLWGEATQLLLSYLQFAKGPNAITLGASLDFALNDRRKKEEKSSVPSSFLARGWGGRGR